MRPEATFGIHHPASQLCRPPQFDVTVKAVVRALAVPHVAPHFGFRHQMGHLDREHGFSNGLGISQPLPRARAVSNRRSRSTYFNSYYWDRVSRVLACHRGHFQYSRKEQHKHSRNDVAL